MSAIKVSVIIPTLNRADKLAATIAGLRRQTLSPAEYEILVMDDGSTPPVTITGEVAHPTCRVVRLPGVERSSARNTGASFAQGKILVFLDDDIGVKEDFLAVHLQAHEEWPGALVVGAIHLPPETQQTPFGRHRQQLERTGLPQERGPIAAQNFCTAANMSIARERYFDLGGFNPAICSAEDQDLALRHTARAGQIVFLPEAETIHYDHAFDIQSYCRRVEWGSENIIPFCQQWPDWSLNVQRQNVNGPIRWGHEAVLLSVRKAVKAVLAAPQALPILWRLTAVLEHRLPTSPVLPRLYSLLLGIHLQKGYCQGIKRFGMQTEEQRQPTESTVKSVERFADTNSNF